MGSPATSSSQPHPAVHHKWRPIPSVFSALNGAQGSRTSDAQNLSHPLNFSTNVLRTFRLPPEELSTTSTVGCSRHGDPQQALSSSTIKEDQLHRSPHVRTGCNSVSPSSISAGPAFSHKFSPARSHRRSSIGVPCPPVSSTPSFSLRSEDHESQPPVNSLCHRNTGAPMVTPRFPVNSQAKKVTRWFSPSEAEDECRTQTGGTSTPSTSVQTTPHRDVNDSFAAASPSTTFHDNVLPAALTARAFAAEPPQSLTAKRFLHPLPLLDAKLSDTAPHEKQHHVYPATARPALRSPCKLSCFQKQSTDILQQEPPSHPSCNAPRETPLSKTDAAGHESHTPPFIPVDTCSSASSHSSDTYRSSRRRGYFWKLFDSIRGALGLGHTQTPLSTVLARPMKALTPTSTATPSTVLSPLPTSPPVESSTISTKSATPDLICSVQPSPTTRSRRPLSRPTVHAPSYSPSSADTQPSQRAVTRKANTTSFSPPPSSETSSAPHFLFRLPLSKARPDTTDNPSIQAPQPNGGGLRNPPTSSSRYVANTPHKDTSRATTSPQNPAAVSLPPPRFSWATSRSLILSAIRTMDSMVLHGSPFSAWKLQKVPTLGASPRSSRVQEMYKGSIMPPFGNVPLFRVFLKLVPISVWEKQWAAQEQFNGEFVTDGENFVMEAAALAFLNRYCPSLAPKLLGILKLDALTFSSITQRDSKHHSSSARDTHRLHPGTTMSETLTGRQKKITHIVIVCELYGEDIFDFFTRREHAKRPVCAGEKVKLQFACLNLLNTLHTYGLAHLDFTPENVLLGPSGLKLCDFAKATPVTTRHPLHTKRQPSTANEFYFKNWSEQPSRTWGSHTVRAPSTATHSNAEPELPFQSCEPTVGKGAYMPPECWKVYYRLEEARILHPLEKLQYIKDSAARARYYFAVEPADVYMAGVFLFWLWSEGSVWRCSDAIQDEKYRYLLAHDMDLSTFRECRSWPIELRQLLQSAIHPDPQRRPPLSELLRHRWFRHALRS